MKGVRHARSAAERTTQSWTTRRAVQASRRSAPAAEWEDIITATLLALRGWAGMIRQVELRADRATFPGPAGSLVEFLAIRLILERLAFKLSRIEALERSQRERPGWQE